MIISANLIRKTRIPNFCGSCEKIIPKGNSCIRLFGAAHEIDNPYSMLVHIDCVRQSQEEKIIKVVREFDIWKMAT